MLFDYGYKDTAAFSHFQIFLNFFYTFFIACNHTYICGFSRVAGIPLFSGGFLSSSGVRVPLVCWSCAGCGRVFRWWSCVLMTICLLSYARTYIRAYIRTRTGIFRAQTAIFRLQKHKFSIKSKILFGYSIFMLTFAAQTTSLTINFQNKQQ